MFAIFAALALFLRRRAGVATSTASMRSAQVLRRLVTAVRICASQDSLLARKLMMSPPGSHRTIRGLRTHWLLVFAIGFVSAYSPDEADGGSSLLRFSRARSD